MLAVLCFLVSLLAAGERLPSRDRDAVALQTKDVVEKADLQYKDYKELPACAEGILNISGAYKVTSNRSFEGCLRVHGLEAVVHLLAPITFSGNATFTGHIVVEGGGDLESACLVVKGVATLEGQLEFKRCINSAEGKNNDEAGKGGALRAEQVKLQGQVKFEGCFGRLGGAIYAETINVQDSRITASRCRAKEDGGVLHSEKGVTIQHSFLTATNCSAERGGVIHSLKQVVLDTSSLSATSCSARKGGVIYSSENLVLNKSTLTAANCSAIGDGGVIRSQQQVVLDTSTLTAANCSAIGDGGVVSSRKVVLDTSSLSATSCGAGSGGVIYSDDNLVLNKSTLTAANCSARVSGGVLRSQQQVVLDTSSLTATSCSAYAGGAISSITNLTLNKSSLTATSCTATGSGGALHASNMTALNSDVLVSSSTAGRSGGAAYVDGTMTMAQSRVDIGNCSAGDTGGGLYMSDLIGDAVNMSNCSAAAMGGCIRVKQSLKLDEAVLAGCAASAGNAVASTGDVHIGNLSLLGGETEQSRNYFSVGGSLRLGTMTCDDTPECEVSSQEAEPQVGSVARCPLGAGRGRKRSSVGCITCNAGTMLLQPKPDAACIPCPELAEECRPSHVKLRQGITVNTTDFSQVLHCPNPAACPEHVLTAPVPLDPPSYSLYCQKGYEGPACSSCSSGYGRSDGSVLVCVKCSESTQQLVRNAAQYALKDVALFAVAAHGVLGAKAEKKNSAVYLNQLLAFATVSSAALTGVMQTSAVASLRDWTTNLLESIEIFSDFLQGQSGATKSMECLLAFAGGSLVFAHAAASLMPILLVLTLAMIKDPRVSLVVGTNVFLPGFTSKFGKYLVAYRLQPQDQGGELLTPFLPGVPGAFWWVLACITACFALGAWSWTRMALSTEKPSPPHVLYLTQAYKPNFEAWEVERLVRKMMLTVVSTVLPVTLSPALQMQFISAILLGSLMLYAHVRPYKEDDWNRLELRLLGCAVLITGFTTCLLANDSHWSRSKETQFALMFFIAAPAAIVCATLAVLVAVEMYRERARQKEAEALEALNKASEN